jgi:hypothetical protein
MAVTIVDTVSAYIETVRPNLEKYFEASDQIASWIKKSTAAEKVNRYLYRIPVQKWNGGVFSKLQLSEGTVPSGNGMALTKLTAGYFGSSHSFRVSFEQKESTNTVINVFQEQLKNAILESQVQDDITFHGDGTGKLTNAASTGTSTTLTFADTTDTLGINRLREGMTVDVWDSAGSTLRSGGPYQITNINYATKTVTFASAPTGMGTTDLLAVANVDVYGPSTPTSFSSTWPGDALTNNPGLTGDSFRHGLYYANDDTSANYYLGVQKSALPQLIPVRVNASSSALVFNHGQQMLDQMMQRFDKDIIKGIRGISHFTQRRQVFNIGTAIATKFVSGTQFGQSLDISASNRNYDDTFDFCGVSCAVSKRQYTDRFDFINPEKWLRAQLFETKFLEDGNGNTIHMVRNGDGNLVMAFEFHVVQGYDFACVMPASGAYISNLSTSV